MLNRLNTYLLTNRPLLWNTKAITVVSSAVLIHVLFFISGFASLDVTSLGYYYSSSMISGGVATFSVLCSAALLIGWLVFLLRNNAFKEFYSISRFFLAKQFLLLVLILSVSITFFHSFQWGVEARARAFTGAAQLKHEAEIVNLAAKFLPHENSDYFKLNRCSIPDSLHVGFRPDFNYYDTTLAGFFEPENARIRAVLRDPDAFTYVNYCRTLVTTESLGPDWIARGDAWLAKGHADSVRYVITELQRIADRYHIQHRLHPDSLAALPFRDSMHTVTRFVAWSNPDDNSDASHTDYVNGQYRPGSDYVIIPDLITAINFIDRAHHRMWSNDELELQTIFLYVAICLAIILFSYRLFPRNIFLISVIGSIIWGILIMGFAFSASSFNTALVFLLILCYGSLALSSLQSNSKKVRGVLLTWHLWLTPFVMMMLIGLITQDYYSHRYDTSPGLDRSYSDKELEALYPVGYWITSHAGMLLRINLPLVIAYVALVIPRLAHKWQGSPEE